VKNDLSVLFSFAVDLYLEILERTTKEKFWGHAHIHQVEPRFAEEGVREAQTQMGGVSSREEAQAGKRPLQSQGGVKVQRGSGSGRLARTQHSWGKMEPGQVVEGLQASHCPVGAFCGDAEPWRYLGRKVTQSSLCFQKTKYSLSL
jgi:hypothetical protein